MTLDDIKVTLIRMIQESIMDFENKEIKKSGLKLEKVEQITLHYAKYVPLKGGSHIDLPACIANSKSCINIKNDDDLCFKYGVLCLVHMVYEQVRPERVSKYKELLRTTHVKIDGLTFPSRCMTLTSSSKGMNLRSQSMFMICRSGTDHWPSDRSG